MATVGRSFFLLAGVAILPPCLARSTVERTDQPLPGERQRLYLPVVVTSGCGKRVVVALEQPSGPRPAFRWAWRSMVLRPPGLLGTLTPIAGPHIHSPGGGDPLQSDSASALLRRPPEFAPPSPGSSQRSNSMWQSGPGALARRVSVVSSAVAPVTSASAT